MREEEKEEIKEARVAIRIFHKAARTAWIYFPGQFLVLLAADIVFYRYVPWWWLLTWNGIQILNILFRLYLLRNYLSALDLRKPKKARKYLNQYFYSILFTGFLWCGLVAFLPYVTSESEYFYIYSLILIMTFAATSSIGPIKRYFLAFVLPMNLAMFTDLLLHGETVYYLAAFSLLFSLYFSLRSSNMHLKEYTRILRDEAKANRLKRHFEKLASTDLLTGLPNRYKFFDLFNKTLVEAERDGKGLLLFFLDLDRFKKINDTLGHHVGDLVLKRIGSRLMEHVGANGVAARLAGDEFVVLIPDPDREEETRRIAHGLVETIRRPMEIEGHTIRISPSIGIVRYPDHGRYPNELLQCADTAMYLSKRNGKPEWYRPTP